MLLYTYDAWNRLVAARRRVDAQTPVVAYEYDGLNRRIRRQVDNSGVGVVPGSDAGGIDGIQAGNLNEHYYYAGWRVIEERDNSANTLAQTVYGTEYIDAPVCRDRNTDVTAGGSARYFVSVRRSTRRRVDCRSWAGGLASRSIRRRGAVRRGG